MRVAYLGPPGTVSDEALTAAAPDLEGVPLPTLRDVVMSVQEGRFERALVPIENALEGGVDPVLDCLALEAHDVSIIGEVVHPVSYCLAAGREIALDEVTMVLSHPQALGQCQNWIAKHLPRARVVPAVSTADAVRDVATDTDGTRVAIGPRIAARHYGAVTLAEDLEDDPGNATRFGWLARTEAAPVPPDGRGKTMLLFWGAGSASLAGSSRAWPCSRSRASTSSGSSRGRCAGRWASTCSSSTSKGRWERRPWPARSQISISTPRWFESSARSVRGAKRSVGTRYTAESDGYRRPPGPLGSVPPR